MKISNASKKVLASALSAAMVVAFAPTVAMAKVIDKDGGTTTEPTETVSSEVVATVSYTQSGKIYTTNFESTETATDDNAAQAALVFASELQNESKKDDKDGVYKDGAKDVTVKFQKDVVVDGVSGTDEDGTTSVWNPEEGTEVASTLYAGGDVTIDLNGHTVTNNNAADSLKLAQGAETGVFTVGTAKSFADGLRIKPAATEEATIYATSLDNAKAQFVDNNTDSKSNVLPAGADVSSAVLEDNDNFYSWNSSLKSYVKAGSIKDAGEDAYYKFKVSYKTAAIYAEGGVAATGKVTIKNGTVKSVDAAAITATKQREDGKATNALVIDGATVSAEQAGAIAGTGYVTVQGGSNVEAVAKGAKGAKGAEFDTLKAIEATSVTVPSATEKELKADAKANQTNVATVKATLTDGGSENVEAVASAIDATNVSVERAATITASATGIAGKTTTTGGATNPGEDGSGTGVVKPGTSTSETYTAKAESYAVKAAANATLNYGTYDAVYAVSAENGTIWSGSYKGYVEDIVAESDDKDLTISGGAFSYDVSADVKDAEDKVVVAKNTLSAGEDAPEIGIVKGGDVYYAYRKAAIAVVAAESTKANNNNSTDSSTKSTTLFDADVPAAATYTQGKKDVKYSTIADKDARITKYVNDKFLTSYVEKQVTEQTEIGKELVDYNTYAGDVIGNTDKVVKLDVELGYVNPYGDYSDATVAGNAEKKALVDSVNAIAKENTQTIQGAYTVDAKVKYGTEYKADGKTRKGMATVETLASMGDAALDYTVYPVTAISAAGVYAVGNDGKGTLVPSTGDKAVTAGAAGKQYFTTATVGSFGVIFSTTDDLTQQTEQKLNKLAADAVISEIDALGAFGEINAANYADALKAAKAAQVSYEKLTDAQKALVPVEKLSAITATISAAQAVADQQPAAKKANTVKASKSKVSVKKGKKATVKVTKAKGKVTVKSSSKNAKVSYKSGKITIKGAKKGKATVTVKAAGNASYKAKTLKIKVTVK